VIPIDIRWLNALKARGVDIEMKKLKDEDEYREVEDVLCRAAVDEGLLPSQADAVVFSGSNRAL
jgi:hypothetical protein